MMYNRTTDYLEEAMDCLESAMREAEDLKDEFDELEQEVEDLRSRVTELEEKNEDLEIESGIVMEENLKLCEQLRKFREFKEIFDKLIDCYNELDKIYKTSPF